MSIRKMIVELLLANHPQDCLVCIRSKKCELQSLAERFGIRKIPFRHGARDNRPPEIDSGTLVRDMAKCIKCGRCVEACNDIQGVAAINTSRRSINYEICTPYRQTLSGSPCIFCGQCASVCPVGAIYGNDQTAEAWAALNDKEHETAALIAPALGEALGKELGLAPGSVSAGKMATALKTLGFQRVFDAGFFAGEAGKELYRELEDRVKNGGALPLITGCSPGWDKFAWNCYPGLSDHFWTGQSPEQIFGRFAIETRQAGISPSKVISVSISPCIAKKLEAEQSNVDLVLTVKELARMIRLAGISFVSLPESPFDDPGAGEAGTGQQGTEMKTLAVNGFANARKIMDAIQKGECDAVLAKINNCHAANC